MGWHKKMTSPMMLDILCGCALTVDDSVKCMLNGSCVSKRTKLRMKHLCSFVRVCEHIFQKPFSAVLDHQELSRECVVNSNVFAMLNCC